jgi:hypothetical protein
MGDPYQGATREELMGFKSLDSLDYQRSQLYGHLSIRNGSSRPSQYKTSITLHGAETKSTLSESPC